MLLTRLFLGLVATDEATRRCPERTMSASDVVPSGPADNRPFDAAFCVGDRSRHRQHQYRCRCYRNLLHLNILRFQSQTDRVIRSSLFQT